MTKTTIIETTQTSHALVADHGGGSFAKVIPSQHGISHYRQCVNADVLDAWYEPSPKVVEAISNAIPWICRTSPPVFGEGLRSVIARQRSLKIENVLAAGGSSEIIHLLARELLELNSKVVILDPMYGEYSHVLEHIVGCEIQRVILSPKDGFSVSVDTIVDSAKGADAVFLVNPNNPTGYALSRDEILEISRRLDAGTLLIVDETYIDFVAGVPSIERIVEERNNLVVIKSLSKFYALSGLRAGYLVAPDSLVRQLMRLLPPWAVSLPAQIAAVEALSDEAYYQEMAQQTDMLRADLASRLRKIAGLHVFDGAANYILIGLLDPRLSANELARQMADQNVFIRNCSTQGPSMQDRFVRIAVKDAESNERILEALELSIRRLSIG